MTIIKERRLPRNVNYPRFYEFDPKVCLICSECPASKGTSKWADVAKVNLGVAVHTNWKEEDHQISTVYICESPSNKETSHALPSVGATGKGIYESQYGSITDYWLDLLDDNIYRTNIVRCQADAGLQKSIDTTRKNQRVREAFEHCQDHLFHELEKIFQTNTSSQISFVLAIGKYPKGNFPIQIKKTKNIINRLKDTYPSIIVDIKIQPHLSRNNRILESNRT
jgi:hypothetical protein